MTMTIWALLAALGLVGIDQLSKYLVDRYLLYGDLYTLIPGFLNLKYIHNDGAVFGILSGGRYFFVVIVTIIVLVFLFMMIMGKVKSKLAIWAMALIIAGGIGNLIDRIVHGYVIDFLLFDFPWFPFVFNFADVCVVVGGVMLFVYLLVDIFRGHNQEIAS